MAATEIKKHVFGKPDTQVTRVGLGGEGVLRTFDRAGEARAVIQEALAQGITYYDCARVYADSERYYGSLWKKHPQTRLLFSRPANPPGGTGRAHWRN
jgi:aryl-alcohol dehydrogenase-like predicted oxidoreductase